MHGADWESVVDKDSFIINEHHRTIGNFFHKDLAELAVPVLLTGSEKDEYITDISSIYGKIKKQIKNCTMKVYENGGHPACLTAGDAFLRDLKRFIRDDFESQINFNEVDCE